MAFTLYGNSRWLYFRGVWKASVPASPKGEGGSEAWGTVAIASPAPEHYFLWKSDDGLLLRRWGCAVLWITKMKAKTSWSTSSFTWSNSKLRKDGLQRYISYRGWKLACSKEGWRTVSLFVQTIRRRTQRPGQRRPLRLRRRWGDRSGSRASTPTPLPYWINCGMAPSRV